MNKLPWGVYSRGWKMLLPLKGQRYKPFQVVKYKSKIPGQGKVGTTKPYKLALIILYMILNFRNILMSKTNPLLTQTYWKGADAIYLISINIRYVLHKIQHKVKS